jgi:hypothetical protein
MDHFLGVHFNNTVVSDEASQDHGWLPRCKKGKPSSRNVEIEVRPLLIESNRPLQLNHLLTRKSYSFGHEKGER